MILRTAICAMIACGPAVADSLIAVRTIRANAQLTSADIARAETAIVGAVKDPELVLGMEARVNIYAGRPIFAGDLGPPAIIERNQIVPLVFEAGVLSISTEGRALGRAAIGESLRVMNLASRSTVSGTVLADGSVRVSR